MTEPLDSPVAAAQARRDWQRLSALRSEAAVLRHRVEELERSPSRRALAPARAAAHALLGLVGKARHPALPLPGCAVPRVGRGQALVIDNDWPRPDRDAGSVEIVHLMQALRALGFAPVLASAKQHDGPQPARDRLMAQGLRCLVPADAASVSGYLARHGPAIDVCVLCRVYGGGEFLDQVQRHAPQARLVFNSIDLNYLREQRRATLLGDAALGALIAQVRAREEAVIRGCDATVVVSDAERALLADTLPDCLVAQMPLARPVHPPHTPFGSRAGIGFIGSFDHAPNADAVRSFLAGAWGLIHRALPDCEFQIVGANAPADLLDGAVGPVRLLGQVPDIGPWFESLRLTVAPLRFGAGAKGKVASSLAAGVPCVATPVAAEGMALAGEGGVLVADSPEAFAAATIQAYGDAALWGRLSEAAVAYAETTLSVTAWEARLDALLRRIGL